MPYQPPFPWFGGKSTVAEIVWQGLGQVRNYVEPFFGSGAVLFLRPGGASGIETVNDKDGFVSNFWRALQSEPAAVAQWADWPVNENDLHARHAWLVGQKKALTARLEGNPLFYDAQIAGWWVWGLCCWIGSSWCNTNGSWQVVDDQLVHLGTAGPGIHRQRVHLGTASQGIHRQRVHLESYMQDLADRLRHVRVCSGDWSRVCGPTPTVTQGLTGVFLDPPYAHSERDNDLYTTEDDCSVAVRDWACEWGDDPRMRICLAGYEGEHAMPETWQVVAWKAAGGYGRQGNGVGRANAARERLWFSPHCNIVAQQMPLFA